MKTKIPLALGALVIIAILCKFFDVMELIIRDNLYEPAKVSNTTTSIVGIAASACSIGFFVFGILAALNPSKFEGAWNKRFKFSVIIPGYFLFALIPMVAAMFLFFFTGQKAWLNTLGWLSFLSIFIFLGLALHKDSN